MSNRAVLAAIAAIAATVYSLACAATAARAGDPIAASLEVEPGALPGTISIVWSLQGPLDMPPFTIDPTKVRVSYRRVGAPAATYAVAKDAKPLAAARVEMTNFDALQAFVPFRDAAVPTGPYVVEADARGALTWNGARASVALVTPPSYVYVTDTPTAHQPDVEIASLAKAYPSHTAVVRMPFVVNCLGVGIEPVPAGSRLRIVGFTRTAARQVGNGPYAVHATRATGPNGVGSQTGAFTALAAIDAGFTGVRGVGNAACVHATTDFASPDDVERYLEPSSRG